jgi:hypothetical protein
MEVMPRLWPCNEVLVYPPPPPVAVVVAAVVVDVVGVHIFMVSSTDPSHTNIPG